MTGYQKREAARIGNNRALETAEDAEVQRKARELRAENARRAKAAK
jgi:hypothetical protein